MSETNDRGKGIANGDGPLGLRGAWGTLANLGIIGVILGVWWLQQRDMMAQAAIDRAEARAATQKQWEVMHRAQETTERLTAAVNANQTALMRQTAIIEELAREIRRGAARRPDKD